MNFSIPLPLDMLPAEAFVYLAVFARVAAMMMLFPGFGERNIQARIKILMAAVVVLTITPVVRPMVPPMPENMMAMLMLIGLEVVIGIALGALVRMLMGALQVAGQIIAFSTGLAYAQGFDPTQGIQTTLVGTILAIIAVTMIFVTDLHHLMLAGIVDSYWVFAPGNLPPIEDFAQTAIRVTAETFSLAMRMAAPFLVVGLTVYIGVGILSRLMPAVQIFFIVMPANIMIGFSLMAMLISAMMMAFLTYFEASVAELLLR